LTGSCNVCAWNKKAGNKKYVTGTSDDLATNSRTIVWAIKDKKSGINYFDESADKTTFFTFDSVTVKKPSLTVTFETSGGSTVPVISLKSGEKAAKPKAPTKEGYTFEGWFIDKNLRQEYDFSAKVTESFTVYAKWTAKDGGTAPNTNNTGDNTDDDNEPDDNQVITPPVDTPTDTTPPEEDKKLPGWLWYAVGGGAGAVIFVIVLVIILTSNSKKKKQQQKSKPQQAPPEVQPENYHSQTVANPLNDPNNPFVNRQAEPQQIPTNVQQPIYPAPVQPNPLSQEPLQQNPLGQQQAQQNPLNQNPGQQPGNNNNFYDPNNPFRNY